jgi:hypothetical protein
MLFDNEGEGRRQGVDCAVAPRYQVFSLCLPKGPVNEALASSLSETPERATTITRNEDR